MGQATGSGYDPDSRAGSRHMDFRDEAKTARQGSEVDAALPPSVNRMMWPTLAALKRLGGSAATDELLQAVTEEMRLPSEVQNLPHANGRHTKVQQNLSWATTYLKKAGYIDNSVRGIWTLTEAGEVCDRDDVEQVRSLVRKQMAAAKRSASVEPAERGEVAASSPDPERDWKDELVAELKALAPDAFERLSQRLLREAGFVKVEVTGRSGDGGIDGIGVLRVNLLSFHVLFQCKRYAGSVGPGTVRDFRGAMVGRSDKGLLITTGTFTAEARREASRDGAPPIELIDGNELCDLLKGLQLGVTTRMVEQVVVDLHWLQRV